MREIQTPAFSLFSRLEEFEQFQEFCFSYQHGIKHIQHDIPLYSQIGECDYQSRRATTFIYTFFVFNDIYKIDWATSLKKPDDEPTEWLDLSQQKMFWNLVHFCFQNQPMIVYPYTRRLVEYPRTNHCQN